MKKITLILFAIASTLSLHAQRGGYYASAGGTTTVEVHGTTVHGDQFSGGVTTTDVYDDGFTDVGFIDNDFHGHICNNACGATCGMARTRVIFRPCNTSPFFQMRVTQRLVRRPGYFQRGSCGRGNWIPASTRWVDMNAVRVRAPRGRSYGTTMYSTPNFHRRGNGYAYGQGRGRGNGNVGRMYR